MLTAGEFKEVMLGVLPTGTKIAGDFRVDSNRSIEFDVFGSVDPWAGKTKASSQIFNFETKEDSRVSLLLDNRASVATPKTVELTFHVDSPEPKALIPSHTLTKLDVSILRNLGRTKDPNALASLMNVDVDVIANKISQLTSNGYITASKGLTEKGYITVNEDSNDTPPTQREREILTREIVRIPCRHCGSLVDQTLAKCPSCGAPLVR